MSHLTRATHLDDFTKEDQLQANTRDPPTEGEPLEEPPPPEMVLPRAKDSRGNDSRGQDQRHKDLRQGGERSCGVDAAGPPPKTTLVMANPAGGAGLSMNYTMPLAGDRNSISK